MLSGFNTNVRHRGVLFHVQTEDSGRRNPHVMTHLFHGGDIFASEKQDYAGKLESEDVEADVRTLMEGQHKSMLQRLKRGHYDPAIEARLGSEAWGDDGESAETLRPAPVAAPAAPLPPKAPQKLNRGFGDGIVSEKPLDEVVLEYLVENARKRKRAGK